MKNCIPLLPPQATSPSRNLPATGGKKRHISVRPTIWKPSTKYLCSLTWKKTIFNLHKKGTRLGIVTSKTRIQLGRSFVNYSIYPCFEHIICEDDTPFHKPDPRPLLECINRFHANPTSTLFIGDTFSDSECAHHAGIDFGLASWGCQDSASIKTDVVLNSPEDLLKYV